jgi:hypothetical protein
MYRHSPPRTIVMAAAIGIMAILAALLLIVNPLVVPRAAAASVSTCSPTGTVDVNGKTYEVQNNQWNSAATGQECISADNVSGAFSVTTANNSLATNGAPASYPSIYKGCHWGDCTNNSNLPIQMSSLASANSSWSISTVSGAWDASYDIWFNQTPTTTGQPNGTEVMVWINHNGPPQPFGSQVATATINGSNWNVWTGTQNGGGTSWHIISYVDTTPTTSVNFDLKNFFTDAIARGSIQNNWYLIDVEAGFELWQNGAGMASQSFSVSPVATGSGPTPTPPPTATPLPGTPTPTQTPRPPTPTPTPASGGNGVTATGVVASSSPYFTEEDVKLSNPAAITALTATITVQKTTGVAYNGQYVTFGGVTMTHTDTGSTIVYTATLNSGQTILPSTNLLVAAQFSGNGTAHSTTGDTWSLTTTSGGATSTQSGHF